MIAPDENTYYKAEKVFIFGEGDDCIALTKRDRSTSLSNFIFPEVLKFVRAVNDVKWSCEHCTGTRNAPNAME